MSVDQDENLAKRRMPCLISYLSPFRIVTSVDRESWDVDIERINERNWDYVALHEMVGGVDTGLPSPYHMAVCRDGALALRSSNRGVLAADPWVAISRGIRSGNAGHPAGYLAKLDAA